MNWIKLRLDYIIFGVLGIFLLVSILTADFRDPTFFNQIYPSIGVKNWTGLIGALIGGSLLEIFGASTLLIPWLFVRISLHRPRKLSLLIEFYYSFMLVFVLSIFHEMALKLGLFSWNEKQYFLKNGYAGELGLIWINSSIDMNLGIFVLFSLFTLSIVKIYNVISPIPFFLGIFVKVKKITEIFFTKNLSVKTVEIQKKKNLPNFKGSNNLPENEY